MTNSSGLMGSETTEVAGTDCRCRSCNCEAWLWLVFGIQMYEQTITVACLTSLKISSFFGILKLFWIFWRLCGLLIPRGSGFWIPGPSPDLTDFQDCPKCLLIFSDVILYRMHMSMHGSGSAPSATWQCSMCKRQCVDRRHFQSHTIRSAHSLIPLGVVIPPTISFHCGLPDLSSICPPNDMLNKIVEELQKKWSRIW